MGNRAVIAFKSSPTVGIYLHWNGGPESILAFVNAAKKRGARPPKNDATYAFGALASTIGLFIHQPSKYRRELLSFGIGPLSDLDTYNGDNGLFWIHDDWRVSRDCGYSGSVSYDGLGKDGREQHDGIVEQIMHLDTAKSAKAA